MAKVDKPFNDEMMDKLMPVLTKAIQGDFSGRIKMQKGDPLNEIYAGVQVLLDVITEQIKALEELNPDAPKYSSAGKASDETASN